MLHYYGMEFLQGLQSYYAQRLALAMEHGYSADGNKYFWLYTELDLRVKAIRQTLLFLDALPKFMGSAAGEESMGFALKYIGDYFKAGKIGAEDRQEGEAHPYFNDGNPYWIQFQEAHDNFGIDYDLTNTPMLYVDLTEYVVRGLRLYFLIRERKFCAIDRGKFDELMKLKSPLPITA
ncbi:MAG: hypothetical protein Q3982_03110 [Phoenicibacter congonensis]|uniref:Uncharacterized protein n=1 Tax=Phoenicibacter congonensis TaxID=1944646 RepID=A0AA43U5V3_9ACTN|nr:hypothetical protein [Phoenicibacter congonensis]